MEPRQYGRYTIVEQIGQGGMSVVYKAKDPVLDRFVALKLLHPHLAERADSRARFAREAKAVAQLKHANIVEVFDYAPAESARSYIVTEYIDGPTLREFLAEHNLRSPEAAIVLLQPIADALTRAHDAGIVHRDVKPENIMIRTDGSPVLMDFGIAQMIDMPTLTATGTILGSPAHMAPEVIDGSEVGAAADVFSFGTVLYWAISGCLPFTGPNPSALFRRILETDFDPLSRHSETAGFGLEQLVSECLAKLPEMRPSARQVSARMRLHLEHLKLREFDQIRKQLIDNREQAENNLVEQTVDELLTRAEEQVNSGKVPQVLDLVNRALAHRPNESRARRLLSTLERRQTILEWVRWTAITLAVFIPILSIYLYVRTPVLETDPTNKNVESSDESTSENTPRRPAKVATARKVIQPPPSRRAAVPRLDATSGLNSVQTADATMEAGDSKPPSPLKDVGVRVSPDAAVNETNKKRLANAQKVTENVRKVPAKPKPTKPPPTQTVTVSSEPTPEPERVLVKVKSAYLAGTVVLNGNRTNKLGLFKLSSQGIKLKPGVHSLVIESDACVPDRRRIELTSAQKTFNLSHRCIFKNATLRVNSKDGQLEIRDKDDPSLRVLGSTNQSISLPMKKIRIRKNLLIRVAGDRFENLQVRLEAGKNTSIRFN